MKNPVVKKKHLLRKDTTVPGNYIPRIKLDSVLLLEDVLFFDVCCVSLFFQLLEISTLLSRFIFRRDFPKIGLCVSVSTNYTPEN